MPKVLVVDDHPMIIHAVEALVQDIAPAVAVLQSRTLLQAIGLCRDSTEVCMVLLDLNLPDSRDADGVRLLREQFPLLPIVVYTGQEHEFVKASCLRAGASDFVLKSGNRSALSNVLEAYLGQYASKPEARAGRPESVLSARQLDVLRLMVAGSTTKEIADALNIGEATVKTHIKVIYSRTSCRNRVELSHWYAKVPNGGSHEMVQSSGSRDLDSGLSAPQLQANG